MKACSKIALGLAAAAALLFTRKKGIAGVGKVLESDYSSALVTTKDGRHAVQFMVIGDQISVSAKYSTSESDRDYMGEWDYWTHIGYYTTLSGAKRGAKRWMAKMGYELSDKDLNKI